MGTLLLGHLCSLPRRPETCLAGGLREEVAFCLSAPWRWIVKTDTCLFPFPQNLLLLKRGWPLTPRLCKARGVSSVPFPTSQKDQYLLPHQEQVLHCYGYRIHLLWIFLLFQSFEKVSQAGVCHSSFGGSLQAFGGF